jgi:Ca-activated chloride channel homolog
VARALNAGSILLLALLGGRASASQAPPVFEVGLEMTNITVTVRDARGNLVSDLSAEDFVVREDGRLQQVQVFGAAAGQAHAGENGPRTAELALNLGMLFDTSESMRQELRLSQESAIRFLEAIPRAKDLLLVFFDRDIRISRYDSENQQGIFERILETQGGGFTALYDAIAVYLSRIWDSPGRKVLVLFSDGVDTTSSIGEMEVLRMIRSSSVTVYPVAFKGELPKENRASRKASEFLADLATTSGGRVFEPRASKELAAIYQSILDELGSQYVLGYVSDNAAHDGRFRKVSVELKRPGLRVRCRPGYDAPKDEPAKAK